MGCRGSRHAGAYPLALLRSVPKRRWLSGRSGGGARTSDRAGGRPRGAVSAGSKRHGDRAGSDPHYPKIVVKTGKTGLIWEWASNRRGSDPGVEKYPSEERTRRNAADTGNRFPGLKNRL